MVAHTPNPLPGSPVSAPTVAPDAKAEARRLLGYRPGEPDVAVREAVDWLRRHGDLQHLGAPPPSNVV